MKGLIVGFIKYDYLIIKVLTSPSVSPRILQEMLSEPEAQLQSIAQGKLFELYEIYFGTEVINKVFKGRRIYLIEIYLMELILQHWLQ